MTKEVKLHAGYIGKTREGKRVEVKDGKYPEYWHKFRGDNGVDYGVNGGCISTGGELPFDIIGPWDEPSTQYNDGEWHGWDGGDCPVHPESMVEHRLTRGGIHVPVHARNIEWSRPLLFRVTKEHKEPREWLISMSAMHVQRVPSGFKHDGPSNYVHVREVLE